MNAATTEAVAQFEPNAAALFDAFRHTPASNDERRGQSLCESIKAAGQRMCQSYTHAVQSGESFALGGPAWDKYDADCKAFDALLQGVRA